MHEIERFIPDKPNEEQIPLERYLQPLPRNVVAAYVVECTNPGNLVMDPFPQRGTLLVEAAASGRRGIAASFNPVRTLLVHGILTLPSPHEIDAATVRLGDSLKRGIPLREHINQLYASSCHHCARPLVVDYFLWHGEDDRPVEKYYHCTHCDAEGRFPVEDTDLTVLDSVEKQGVHYWYLLERLAQPHEPERKLAEELLNLYTPRNLYALTDLSMKIETLFVDSPLQNALQLILVQCFDTCSKLGASPLPRPTVLHLRPPTRFMERNVWHAFEEAYRLVRLLSPSGPMAVTTDTESLVGEAEAEVSVINEPLHRVAARLPPSSVSLVVAAPPPYYRPFWTLSYLWSGWLWGREKATLLKPLLRRKMMGWSWYRRSLGAALKTLHRPLRPQGSMIFILERASLTHINNVILAAVGAAFKLRRILYQPEDVHPPEEPMQGVDGAYRLTFTRDDGPGQDLDDLSPGAVALALQEAALRAARELLRERGEALHFGWLHSAIYQRWSRDGLLTQALALGERVSMPDFLDEQMESALQEALAREVLELLPKDADEASGAVLWWLKAKGYPPRPLGDRLERAVYQILTDRRDCSHEGLCDDVYSRFPGIFTPPPGLVQACIDSYAQRDDASDKCNLRPEEEATSLAEERVEGLKLLMQVGQRLGYQVSLSKRRVPQLSTGTDPISRVRLPRGLDVSWDSEWAGLHTFAFKQTTRFGDILSHGGQDHSESHRYILIADRRLDLLRFRIESEFLLRRALNEGEWQFIKLKHLRDLGTKKHLDRPDLDQIIGLEPLIERPEAQLPLFPPSEFESD
ncbi:MAG: hypothetical protein GTO63_29615 [Anaerolineae bacterium]|nr:hypothetical protein [Anaerolineae bacterium]NIN98874.1 hypothetical protein [Anaerolineae bacterium]NIQ81785.1 hypothetical protein [Anaerolineae bacterium]